MVLLGQVTPLVHHGLYVVPHSDYRCALPEAPCWETAGRCNPYFRLQRCLSSPPCSRRMQKIKWRRFWGRRR